MEKIGEAILPDTGGGLEKWLELNSTFSAQWPNITQKGEPPADADEHKGEDRKYEKYFFAKPGLGDGIAMEESWRYQCTAS